MTVLDQNRSVTEVTLRRSQSRQSRPGTGRPAEARKAETTADAARRLKAEENAAT